MVYGGECFGGNEKGISGANGNFGAGGKREAIGDISHAGDLLISGPDLFSAYLSVELEKESGVNVFGEIDAVYLGLGVKNAPK